MPPWTPSRSELREAANEAGFWTLVSCLPTVFLLGPMALWYAGASLLESSWGRELTGPEKLGLTLATPALLFLIFFAWRLGKLVLPRLKRCRHGFRSGGQVVGACAQCDEDAEEDRRRQEADAEHRREEIAEAARVHSERVREDAARRRREQEEYRIRKPKPLPPGPISVDQAPRGTGDTPHYPTSPSPLDSEKEEGASGGAEKEAPKHRFERFVAPPSLREVRRAAQASAKPTDLSSAEADPKLEPERGANAPDEEEKPKRSRTSRTHPRRRGQGRGLPLAARKAVEHLAMASARHHFERAGYDVKDVSAAQPFDLLCVREGRELHVEVKGTTGSSESVLITEGERRHAMSYSDIALYVLSEVSLDDRHGERPCATGGRVRLIEPWVVTECRIETVTARCYLPPETDAHGQYPLEL